MSSLSKKQLRNAAPLEALPLELTMRYGLPTLHASTAAVRTALGKHVDEVSERADRIGTAEDREAIELLREQVSRVVDGASFPIVFDVVVDHYTLTRFQAAVRDRRQG